MENIRMANLFLFEVKDQTSDSSQIFGGFASHGWSKHLPKDKLGN